MIRSILILMLTLGMTAFYSACGDDDTTDDDLGGGGTGGDEADAGDSDAASDEDEETEEGEEGDEGELPEVDCDGDIPTYDEVAAIAVCTNCHHSELMGDDRNEAPEEDNFDTYAGASREPEELAEQVYEGEMPPEDSGFTLSDDDAEQLYLWALCGAPE